jgi:hypothetical protein
MAEFQITSTQIDALLQEDYVQQDIVDAIDKSTVFKSKLTRTGTIDGRRGIVPVMVKTAQGVGARAEMGPLPPHGGGVYQDAIVTTKSNYARFLLSGQAKAYTSRKSFVRAFDRGMKDTKEGFTLDIARQCWGDGSGTLALVNNGAGYAAGSTTVAVDSAYGVLWGSFATNTTFLFKPGMKVQIGTEDNAGRGYEISTISTTGITFTTGLLAAVVDNARVYRFGSKDNEIEGWLKMVATSSFMTSDLGLSSDSYMSIDRSDYDVWAGNVTSAAAALSLTNIRTQKDALFKRGGQPELMISSTEVVRDYEALLVANQRFLPAVKLEGGATSIEHDGTPLVKDKDAPVKAMSFVTTGSIKWVQRGDPSWLKQGDSVLQRVSGFDAEEAALAWYANLFCEEPRKQAILYNLTVTP